MDDSPTPAVRRDRFWGEGLLSPLSWAAYITWFAIAIDVVDFASLREGSARTWLGAALLIAFIALFCWRSMLEQRRDCSPLQVALVVSQALAALGAIWTLREGSAGVLLIIVAAQLISMLSIRTAVLWLVAFNVAMLWIWSHELGWATALVRLLPLMGFQAFAAVTGLYAVRAERAREALVMANGELLATRELLSESTRSEERLRLSRELHDVAGHKLTALKLNLALLARDPALSARDEVRVSTLLATELLDDIRAVVSELRRHDGVDLSAALNALARAVPGVRIDIEVDADTRLAAIGQAETLLRCAQEAVTNALRHGAPTRIQVHCARLDDTIELRVEDDGSQGAMVRFGNGLKGMRERLDAVGGALDVKSRAGRGVRLVASVPA